MELNDDCISEVLEWLSLTKLRMFSQTCKRIQGLCEGYFRRNFPEVASEAKIEVIDNVNLVYDDNVRYLHLQNVEIVNLMSRTISYQQGDEVTFLSYCPNIKKLTLFDMVCVETVNAIFQETYHQLEHFHSMVINPMKLNTENLKMFFQHNNKIQCLVWKFVIPTYRNDDVAVSRVVDCVQLVVEKATNLQHFFLLINSQLTKRFGYIMSYFTALCDRDNFKSLEIEFDDTEAEITWKSIS